MVFIFILKVLDNFSNVESKKKKTRITNLKFKFKNIRLQIKSRPLS